MNKKIMNELLLKLTESESLKIITKNNINFDEIDFCCSELQVYFLNIKENQLQIGQESAGLVFEAFIKRLKKSINNKLQLHESITQNLGIMWNEKFQGKSGFFMVPTPSGKSNYWVGLDYEIWETFNDINPYVTTWMYNDYNGNIILEVTPFYKWSVQEQEDDDPDFITYDEFMKNYTPLIHRVIPREIADAWVEQAMKVYRGFFSTEENYIRACKENNW